MNSNVNVEKLDIFSHIDCRVAIIVTDSNAGYLGVLHIFMTNDSLATWLQEKRTQYPDLDFRYIEDYLGTAVDFVLNNDFEGLSIHSVPYTSFDVCKDELKPIQNLVSCFNYMSRFGRGKMSIAELSGVMRNQKVYFIGERPEGDNLINKKDMLYGKTIVKRKTNKGDEYEVLTAFLTKESALHFAEQDCKIDSCTLTELAHMTIGLYPILVEPQRTFSVEFSPMSLC